MQLILDAEDIDIKSNMSTIEHESLNEKFLANKITDHLADDICSGNKENIQKQNNVILEQAEDVSDTDKDNAVKNDEILTNNLNNSNGENSKPNIEIDNEEHSEKDNKINSSKIDSEPENNQLKNINEENSQPQKESNLKQPDEHSVESSEKFNVITTDEDAVDCVSTMAKDVDDPVILEDNDEDDISLTTKESNPIVVDNTADGNESSVEIENDDPIILDYKASNTGGLALKEANIVLSDNAKEHKSDHGVNETNNLPNPSNTTSNEYLKLKDVNSLLTPDNNAVDDKAETLKEAGNTLKLDDSATDDRSLKVKEIDDKEKTDPINEEKGIDKNEVADKTEDKNLEQISSPNKVDNLKSCNKEEMDCSEAELSTRPLRTINANESNPPIEIDDEDVKTSEDISESCIEVQELDVQKQAKDAKKIEDKKTEIPSEITSEPKRICKLSNNLDIFSDEEEEENCPKSPEAQIPKNNTPTERVSISVEDDDEIMVIDEDTNVKKSSNKDDSKIASDKVELPPDTTSTNEEVCTDILQENKAVDENTADETGTSEAQETTKENIEKLDTETSKSTDKVEETQQKVKKPLLPKNFVRSYKKNLADMTRDELEEFCILKIVESIVDRSSLGEIKSQLKNLTQTMEECKKKCLMLTKQNKDLQVVLKSVQEEQKSASDVHITPLKITRSVGMQVVMMVEKSNMRKKAVNGVQSSPPTGSTNPTNNRAAKAPLPSANTKTDRKINNPQIPVPRLVPAGPAAKTNQTPAINNSPKQVNNNSVPNGLRVVTPTAKVAEKRSRSQSITVDLTDDEPPAKQQTVQRNFVNQGVRMGGPQQANLIAAQRFGQNINSPRKVYIPISGQAQNVRPGQTIMLKPVQGLHPRQRCPQPHAAKVPQVASPARVGRAPQRHPAPLPEAPKQYQPPNWKTLPPAPDLKLSKVENGIVISWKIDNYNEDNHEVIASYQLYAYQETQSPPSTSLWKKIGDVKALPLPMACTLTQFMAGYKYYFAVRAVDVRSRFGPFSLPGSILLLNKM